MRRALLALFAIELFVGGLSVESTANSYTTPIFVVDGPTIVAFMSYPDNGLGGVAPDAARALSDFYQRAGQVREPLQRKKIAFYELAGGGGPAFVVRVGKSEKYILPTGTTGYYFIAPGKKGHFIYGILADDALLKAADKFFGSASKEVGQLSINRDTTHNRPSQHLPWHPQGAGS
jgi:hypothetical protein